MPRTSGRARPRAASPSSPPPSGPWGQPIWFPSFVPGGGKSKSGERVDAKSARSLSAFWACAELISTQAAIPPMDVVERLASGETAEIEGSPAQALVDLPNGVDGAMTGFTLRQRATWHACTEGDGYCEIRRTGLGEAVSLHVIHPSRVAPPMEREDGQVSYFVRSATSIGEWVEITGKDMIHIPGPGDGISGYAKLEAMRESLGLGLAGQTFAARMFANDLASGAIISRKGTPLGDVEFAKWVDTLKSSIGGAENAGNAYFSNGGDVEVQRTTFEPEKGQVLGTREYSRIDICMFFGVHPDLIGIPSQAKGWASVAAMNTAFVNGCLTPWLVRWEQEIARKLVRDPRRSVQFDVDERMRAEPSVRADVHAKQIVSGVETPNEARKVERRQPSKDPNADKLWINGGTMPLDKAAAQPSPGAAPSEPPHAAPPPSASAQPSPDPSAALVPVFREAARRVVGRETNAVARIVEKSRDAKALADLYAKQREFVVEAFRAPASSLSIAAAGADLLAPHDALRALAASLWPDPVARMGEAGRCDEATLAVALADAVMTACRAALSRKDAA